MSPDQEPEHNEEDIEQDLFDPPSGGFPDPPIETAEQLLPFGGLQWEDFEKLCLRIARLDGDPRHSRRYGVKGQAQGGIDLYSALPSGMYATYQCKKYEVVLPSDIVKAVDKFIAGDWSAKSERFVFCTSHSAIRTQLSDVIEEQRKRLSKLESPVSFEVCDAEELSLTLKGQREIVHDFFGPHWVSRFFGDPDVGRAQADIQSMLDELVDRTSAGRTQFVSNDWAPEMLRVHLDALRTEDPDAFARLNDQIGSPPEVLLLQAAVTTPPEWLLAAGPELWDILARIAQTFGEWSFASRAWERMAERLAGSSRAGALVSAAVAARLDGVEERYDELIRAAAEADERNPRLVLELIPEDTAPPDLLGLLEGLETEDPEERALIAAQATIAHLLTPDTDAARESLKEVRRSVPGSMLIEGLEISLTVQEGRLAVMDSRPLDRAALRAAAAKAREVRERMSAEKRWSEATRLLMLEADVEALLWDREAASKVLRRALPEEKRTTEQKVVLALCAVGRAQDFPLALELLKGADETSTVRLIRLEATEEVGTPVERAAALEGLEQMVREGGQEAAEAALARLAATVGPRPTAWSDESAAYLKRNGYEKAAVTAEAFYRIRHEGFDAAERLLRPHGDAPWALATRLRVALAPGASKDEAVPAAERLLAIGPSHLLRVEAARAYARGGEFGRAREVLIGVARDPGAPEAVRSDAYAFLMEVVGNEQGEWPFAAVLYAEWIDLAPTDERVPRWGPRIANRSRAA